jgi:hypothetical protein
MAIVGRDDFGDGDEADGGQDYSKNNDDGRGGDGDDSSCSNSGRDGDSGRVLTMEDGVLVVMLTSGMGMAM